MTELCAKYAQLVAMLTALRRHSAADVLTEEFVAVQLSDYRDEMSEAEQAEIPRIVAAAKRDSLFAARAETIEQLRSVGQSGYTGFVDDGEGPRAFFQSRERPLAQLRPWFAELARLAAFPIALSERRRSGSYCSGSGRKPKLGSRVDTLKRRADVSTSNGVGICVECGRCLGLTPNGLMSHHKPVEGGKAIVPAEPTSVPCPACGAPAGRYCRDLRDRTVKHSSHEERKLHAKAFAD